jgi:acyl-CoA synthetase (AMP-forming)/AMP-acid ligase II
MSPAFPVNELQYIMNQSQAAMLLSSEKFHGKANEVLKSGLETSPILLQLQKKFTAESTNAVELTETHEGKGSLMLYTSGTTNRPKGVLSPQSVITAQSNSLLQAWNYTSQDHLLHVLPLHHIHGIINAIMTPLLAGSTIEFLFPFNPTSVWNRLATPYLPDLKTKEHISIFTAVPTVYNRLLTTFDSLPADVQTAAKKGIHPDSLKLNMSGSAALPTPTKKAWETLSGGNVLLERYGMTEVGMALSCALPFASRVDGSVGWPLPFVEARLFDYDSQAIIAPGEEVTAKGKERDGEIQLRGPTIFKEYWQNAKATAETFTEQDADGKGPWFKTGDIAVRRHVEGADKDTPEWAKGPMYFISGRASADIIKTGGEKVSALEVERELLGLPEIAEAAVVAVPSGKWGQKVGAVLILKEGATGKSGKQWAVMDMRRALKDKLANYKIPQVMKVVEKIPRNAMGKSMSTRNHQLSREMLTVNSQQERACQGCIQGRVQWR